MNTATFQMLISDYGTERDTKLPNKISQITERENKTLSLSSEYKPRVATRKCETDALLRITTAEKYYRVYSIKTGSFCRVYST